MKDAVYQIVTDRIVAALEAGVVPWKKSWAADVPAPANFVSRKPYRGINVFLLSFQGFASNYWLTFNQAKGLGGSVKKGEKGSPVIFWKFLDGKIDAHGNVEKIPMLRYYTVFNVAQCEGLTLPAVAPVAPFEPIAEAENIVSNVPLCPAIKTGFARAAYCLTADEVEMPAPEAFDAPASYYATLFHELAHATGHVSRLNREGIVKHDSFGSQVYGREELVAEMAASFVCNAAGIAPAVESNAASYLAGWIAKLKADNRAVVVAASAAAKAADWILNKRDAPAPDED